MRKNKLFLFALTTILSMSFVAGCSFLGGGNDDSSTGEPTSSEAPADSSSTPEKPNDSSETPADSSGTEEPEPPAPPAPAPVYGLPKAEIGRYIKDADVLDDGETRVLLYTTNGESGEEDNVIAVRTASYVEDNGWLYGDENIAVVGEVGGWDEYIGSASLVKGVFEYGDVEYNWLMAYAATKNVNDTQFEIGFAVATDLDGEWVKVGDKALVEFDENVYGTGMVGCYAPSLVSLDKASKVRLYYTYADAYGHFTQFVDINAADLDVVYSDAAKTDVNILSGTNHLPTNGGLNGGDAVLMFPNADFAHDCASGKVYAVKDYSPSAATTPAYAERIELGVINEAEFYTVESADGWESLKLWDMFDTPDAEFERLYSACVVSDAYGHIDSATAVEIVYNVCNIAMNDADWMFSQNLLEFNLELSVE